MKLYLSSYRLGSESEKLKMLVPNGKIGYIANALDFPGYEQGERRINHIQQDVDSLAGLGLSVEIIDLRNYFHKRTELKSKLTEIGAIFISGGNVFVLRQAMKLSGLDEILNELRDSSAFLYAGYSAAGCVLAPSLKGYEIVDKPITPYSEIKEVIWEGLGFIDFALMPHWDSNHPESADIDKEIKYCIQNNIAYKAIRDGEVIIVE